MKPLWRKLLLWFSGALLMLALAPLALRLVPLPAALRAPAPASPEILDREGRTLREITCDEARFAHPLVFDGMPASIVKATIAAEDKRFWQHGGVDWIGTARAACDLARRGRVISGGSTITQQLIKLAAPRPRTFQTKLIEAVTAMRLEQEWDKRRILAEYLNRLDYGNGRSGCASAAQVYFGKRVSDLSVAEAALLASLPNAPSRLNPYRHFSQARARQRLVLGRMKELGFISAAECRRALDEPLRLAPPRRIFQAPHFVDLLLRVLPKDDARLAGGRIETALDLELNHRVETILREQLARLRNQHAHNGAVVVLDNRTAEVLALVGSEDYFAAGSGQVNGAWAPRSAGSTFKPFTYLLAFERGVTPATVLADVPTEFATNTGVFSPQNYNHHCHGPTRCRLALANSLNIAAVKALALAGGPAVLHQRLRDCGMTTLVQQADFYGLGLTIGNAEARLLELANAYSCLARLGNHLPWRLEKTRQPSRKEMKQVFDPGAAYLVADILSDNAARTMAFGVQSSLRFEFPVACKTGTSTDYRDNWALGYTPEFTVGVWVGNFDGSPMRQVSGVTGAAPVMHAVFEHLRQRHGTTWYSKPPGIVERPVHPITGKLLARQREGSVTEKFIAGRLPSPECADDYDGRGCVRLPVEYRDWLASGDNWLGGRATIAASKRAEGVRLITPLPGTTFYLDPDLPASGRRLPLRAVGCGQVEWRSCSLECRIEHGDAFATMREGRHELTARDPVTGATAQTWIVINAL